jgi:hypothetical protein
MTSQGVGSDQKRYWHTDSRQSRAMCLCASATIVLFLSGLATPASAVPPVRTYTGTFTSFTITGPCSVNNVSFDVFVKALRDKEAVTTFLNKQGTPTAQGVNGALAVRLTNTTTGKSIDLNIPGPERIDLETNKATITGPWLVFVAPGLPQLLPSKLELLHGRSEFLVDSSGNFTKLLSSVGTMDDICPSLS